LESLSSASTISESARISSSRAGPGRVVCNIHLTQPMLVILKCSVDYYITQSPAAGEGTGKRTRGGGIDIYQDQIPLSAFPQRRGNKHQSLNPAHAAAVVCSLS
jgi:hypothetical protein